MIIQVVKYIFFDNEFLYVPKGIGELKCLMRTDVYKQIPTLTTQSDFVLDGVNFWGFDGIKVVSGPRNKCEITGCHFQNSIGCALMIQKKGDANLVAAKVDGCKFFNCAIQNDHIVRINGDFIGKTCVSLSNCTLSRYRDGIVIYKNSVGSVSVDGDVSISRNVMFNSPRGHLFLKRGKISVTGNYLYNSDKFNADYDRNICSDWGLIYCNHLFSDTESAQNNSEHRILLERNLLYGAYSYGNQARGIYIDDGRGDVICNDNIVLNTQSYSLDSRNVSMHEASSIRNRFKGNIVSSPYQLVSGPMVSGSNNPVSVNNIIMTSKANKTSENVVDKDNLQMDIKDTFSCEDGKIGVSKEMYKVLKRSAGWKDVRKYIKRLRKS